MQPFIEPWRERGIDVLFVAAMTAEQVAAFKSGRDVEHMDVILDARRQMWGLYGVRAIPTTFIIDAEGSIFHSSIGWGPRSLDELKGQLDRLVAPGDG